MANRSVSLILIAVVLACPLLCRSGDCCHQVSLSSDRCTASHCGCGMEEPGGKEVEEIDCQESACDLASSTDRCEDRSPLGHDGERNPDDSACQCFCGGAVVAKICDFEAGETCFYSPSETADTSVLVWRTRNCVLRFDHPGWKSTKNRGRVMRMLHSSFLC